MEKYIIAPGLVGDDGASACLERYILYHRVLRGIGGTALSGPGGGLGSGPRVVAMKLKSGTVGVVMVSMLLDVGELVEVEGGGFGWRSVRLLTAIVVALGGIPRRARTWLAGAVTAGAGRQRKRGPGASIELGNGCRDGWRLLAAGELTASQ